MTRIAYSNPNTAVIGQNVKSLRTAASITQTELANALGITFQQVQKYEKGKNRIGSCRLVDVATIIGCHVMDLLAGTGVKSPSPRAETYHDTRQGVSLCNSMDKLSEGPRKAVETLVRSLANPQ